jgi:hypothetical protein
MYIKNKIFLKRKTLYKVKSWIAVGLFVFLFSTFVAGCTENVPSTIEVTQTVTTSVSLIENGKAGIQPLPSDGNSFYYYASGNRIPLTLSLKWMAVKFVSDDSKKQANALINSIAGPLSQAHQIPQLKLAILPLQDGLTIQTLVNGINSLRANATDFLQVNPVFQTEDAEMTLTDEFIVTFPAGKSMEEIEAINLSYGVEIVDPILGQENTFVLRATVNARRDTLSLANLYQESGVAIYSAPNFVRIK